MTSEQIIKYSEYKYARLTIPNNPAYSCNLDELFIY